MLLSGTPAQVKPLIPTAENGLFSRQNFYYMPRVTQVVLPLPVLRAEAAIAKAEKLAETDKRDAKQNEELSTLLSSVRTEIELAQILGYGKKEDFKPIFDQVKSIEQKSAGGKSGNGWFDELKTRIQKLF